MLRRTMLTAEAQGRRSRSSVRVSSRASLLDCAWAEGGGKGGGRGAWAGADLRGAKSGTQRDPGASEKLKCSMFALALAALAQRRVCWAARKLREALWCVEVLSTAGMQPHSPQATAQPPGPHLFDGLIDLLGKHVQLGVGSCICGRRRQVKLQGRGAGRLVPLLLLLRVGLRQGEAERGLRGRLPALCKHQVGRRGKGAAGRGGCGRGAGRRRCCQPQQRGPELQQRGVVARVERLVQQHGVSGGGGQRVHRNEPRDDVAGCRCARCPGLQVRGGWSGARVGCKRQPSTTEGDGTAARRRRLRRAGCTAPPCPAPPQAPSTARRRAPRCRRLLVATTSAAASAHSGQQVAVVHRLLARLKRRVGNSRVPGVLAAAHLPRAWGPGCRAGSASGCSAAARCWGRPLTQAGH